MDSAQSPSESDPPMASRAPSLQTLYSMSVAEIMQMTNADLRSILSKGPAQFQASDADSPRDLVAKSATLHAMHNPTAAARRVEAAWTNLIGLTNKEIINCAASDANAFGNTLRDIVSFKYYLKFPTGEENDIGGLACVAIEWVSKAVNTHPDTTNNDETQLRLAIVPH